MQISTRTITSAILPTLSHWIRLAPLRPRERGAGFRRYPRAAVARELTPDSFGADGRLPSAEGFQPRVGRALAELLLDPQELVVLRHPVRARRRAGLDLARRGADGEVGDRRVLGLAGAVRD